MPEDERILLDAFKNTDIATIRKLITNGLDPNGKVYSSPLLDWAWSANPTYDFEIVKLLHRARRRYTS